MLSDIDYEWIGKKFVSIAWLFCLVFVVSAVKIKRKKNEFILLVKGGQSPYTFTLMNLVLKF